MWRCPEVERDSPNLSIWWMLRHWRVLEVLAVYVIASLIIVGVSWIGWLITRWGLVHDLMVGGAIECVGGALVCIFLYLWRMMKEKASND